MSDDWDCDNYIIPVLNVQNKEQLKRLEERKLVEESDNSLMNDLFDNTNTKNEITNKITYEITDDTIKNINTEKINNKKEKTVSNQQENELKQKEFSQKLKNKKEAVKKHSDTFGEFIYDEYDYYVDKFG
jgi:hypothetical protein